MTMKSVDTDEPSKAMLDELDKARLRMKPAPTTAVPRKAEVPAEPRATVPPIGGRIDAANAPAPRGVICDASGVKDVTGPPPSPNKFFIPLHPPVRGPPR